MESEQVNSKMDMKEMENVNEISNSLDGILRSIKANNTLSLAFTKHHLRRILMNPVISTPFMDKHNYLALNLRPCLLKATFISSSYAKIVGKIIDGSMIIEMFYDQVGFSLSPWFAKNRMTINVLQDTVLLKLSKKTFELFLHVTQPSDISLLLDDELSALELKSIYSFKNILLLENMCDYKEQSKSEFIQDFRKVSNILTKLEYFEELSNITKSSPITNVDTLVITGDQEMTNAFINEWIRSQWKIKCLEFKGQKPDISCFNRYKGAISMDLNEIQVPLQVQVQASVQIVQMDEICDKIIILKQRFPELSTIKFNIMVIMPSRDPIQPSHLRTFIEQLATKFNLPKLKWTKDIKVFVIMISMERTHTEIIMDTQKIKEVVKNIKKKANNLEFIYFQGPAKPTANFNDNGCAYAIITMRAMEVSFEIVFKVFGN